MNCSQIENVHVWGNDLAALIARPDDRHVSGLSCAIIPHRTFPLRKWYYANPIWYYHAPAEHHRLIHDRDFYRLVDPELRELCRIILEAGLCTTPSCQGHFYLRARFEMIWRELQKEEKAIQTGGLVVNDCEDKSRAVFKDESYSLPWQSFSGFYEQAARHQGDGYLGVVIPADRQDLVSRLTADGFDHNSARVSLDPELSATFGRPTFGICVQADTIKARDEAWRQVTEYFRNLLQQDVRPQ